MLNTLLNNNFLKYFFGGSLLIYLVVLCWVLFFQIGTTDRDSYFVNPDDHLLPFHSTIEMLKKALAYRFAPHGDQFRDIFLVNIMGNLVLLLPWGFLAPLVLTKINNVKRVAISGFLISFSAEVIQYTFSLGIADVDDLIYNTIGAVVGFYLLQVAKYLIPKIIDLPLGQLGEKEYNQKSA